MDRSVGSPRTRSVVGVRGPGFSGYPHLRHVNSCEMFLNFVMSYMKQNKKTQTISRVRSMDWKSSASTD